MPTIQQILIQYWGYSTFRPMQEEIIRSTLNKKDTLGLLPTGGGKSVCFQVPALAIPGICIVVTPLIALMKDQVENLNKKGIKAIAVFSGMHAKEIDIALDNCAYGDIKFLYISPERLENELFIERLKKMKVNFLVVDEAHCISQWGYDFRPSYLNIANIRQILPSIPVLALTATATPNVVEDIQEKLLFKQKNVLQKSFERSNLHYIVYKTDDKSRTLLKLIQENPGTGIIYVRNRRKTQEVANLLIRNNIPANFYHAGLTTEERDQRQNDWMNGKARVIVSTNAFGMGIDKPNVRFVIHLDIPDTVEAYFQEAGRGGRDGKLSKAFLLFNEGDIVELERNFELSFPEIEFIKNVYSALGNFFQIAIGSGEDVSYDFILSDFCSMYNLPAVKTFNAIKFLEKEGYIQVSEAVKRPSRIILKLNKEELYRFQVKYSKWGDFLDVLIRSYSGLFTNFANIDEFSIAKRLGIRAIDVENNLQYLHNNNILEYIPKTDKPQLTYSKERINEKNLNISQENYSDRKNAARQRLDAAIGYVKNYTRCRSLILLSYFGEKTAKRCGFCDVCLNRNKLALSDLEFDNILNQIKPHLKEQPQELQDLISKVKFVDEEKTLNLMRWLIDIGKINHQNGKFYWVGL